MEAFLWNNTRVNEINASETLKVPMSSLRIISTCKLDVSFSIIRLKIPLSGYNLVWHISFLFVDSFFLLCKRNGANSQLWTCFEKICSPLWTSFFLLDVSISKRRISHPIALWNFSQVMDYTEIINVFTERFLRHCWIYFILFNLLNICNLTDRQKFNQELKKNGQFTVPLQ